MRKALIRFHYVKLVAAAIIVGLFAALLANSLKQLTALYDPANRWVGDKVPATTS